MFHIIVSYTTQYSNTVLDILQNHIWYDKADILMSTQKMMHSQRRSKLKRLTKADEHKKSEIQSESKKTGWITADYVGRILEKLGVPAFPGFWAWSEKGRSTG